MTDESAGPVPALPSATVVLARARHEGPEILMVKRHQRTAFGAVYAFPGGVVTGVDRQVHALCDGVSPAEANRRLGVADGGLDFFSAAIRELFEETGVLMARPVATDGAYPADDVLACLRRTLLEDESRWPELLRQSHLLLSADALHYFGHWETPLPRRRRFTTRFFLALLPAGQKAIHDGRELTDSRWLTPARVLELAQAGELDVAFPTARNLELLAEFPTLESLHAWARARWRGGISPVRPVILQDGGRTRFVIPGDPDYPTGTA